MSDIGDWFRSIPIITRSWFSASVALPLIGILGLVDFRNFLLFPELVFSKFQIWRPVTATFFFPTGFQYLINLYFLYHYSTRLETGRFDGRPADYVFMLLFNWICIVVSFSWRALFAMGHPWVQLCHRRILFKRTDGKPGGSPLLLPHVQIPHRFWRPILPVYTGHPVSFFPRLGSAIKTWSL
ncbi:unnamed protein product [Tetraodon nigroviridis]|uniref:Derlin n=1 Tax=Tetraodon nigroviridis TaxID=99883 RepID=Q4RFH5_TETNG|nr:unnamed protein product [Tetraodon nigroviridis]